LLTIKTSSLISEVTLKVNTTEQYVHVVAVNIQFNDEKVVIFNLALLIVVRVMSDTSVD